MMIGKNLTPESMSALQNAVVGASPRVYSRDVIILALRANGIFDNAYGVIPGNAELADKIIGALAEQNLHIVKTGDSDKGV